MTSSIESKLRAISDCLYRLSAKAVITDGDKVLLVKERGDDWWSFPGGGIDYDESPIDALKRELREELGVTSQQISINNQVIYVTVGGVVASVPRANLYYVVKLPINSLKLTGQVTDYSWFKLDELAGLYLSPSTEPLSPLITIIKNLVAI